MILNRLKICIVTILALFNLLHAMEASVCQSPVPKRLVTSSSRCLTFARYNGSNKLSVDRCDPNDINQLIYATKLSKTEAVFHNFDNNKLICYDSCRQKFLVVDREEIENEPEKRRLRRRLNRLLQKEERLLKKAKKKRNLARQQGLIRSFNRLLRLRQRIQTKLYPVRRTMCSSDANNIKDLSGGHPRIRHCDSRERNSQQQRNTNHLHCTLHELMDNQGLINLYASLPADFESYIMVKKRHRVRSLTVHKSDKKMRGQFLAESAPTW